MRTIDEKIQQKHFRNERHRLVLNLLYTVSRIQKQMEDMLAPFGLTGQQMNILRILRGRHPSPTAICVIRERLLQHDADVSRLVDRLRAKELLTREVCDSDRRRVDVQITEKGLELLAKIDTLADRFDALLGSLTLEEAKTVNHLLDKLEP